MFSLALSAALAFAAAQPDPVIPARKAYADCLRKTTSAHLSDKAAPDKFDAEVQGACATQEAALKDALVKSDLARGFKRADAEDGAKSQIEDYLAVAKEDYRGFLESNTKPE